MSELWLVLFWTCVGVVVYTYVGYPLLLLAVGSLMRRRVRKAPACPSVSVVIAAYNEAESIEDRLRNVLESSYAPDRLEVVVASDGSSDRTVEIASSIDPRRVRVLALPRCGKAVALAAAAQNARGDLLVFTDANTVFHRDAIAAMVMDFSDSDVGGVAGNTGYLLDDETESAGRGESLYWRYDTWLKDLETRTGSVVSAHGGIYAIRRELFRPVEDLAVTDDFAISTGVVAQGKRLVFQPAALAYERPMPTSGSEFWRRVRLMTRGLRGVVLRRQLLDPFQYGFYAIAFGTRKMLRRLVPMAFAPLLVSSWVLAAGSTTFFSVAAAQAVFLGLAALGWAFRGTGLGKSPLLYAPFFFCMANVAAMVALWNLVIGRRVERWTPQRHLGKAVPAAVTPVVEARS